MSYFHSVLENRYSLFQRDMWSHRCSSTKCTFVSYRQRFHDRSDVGDKIRARKINLTTFPSAVIYPILSERRAREFYRFSRLIFSSFHFISFRSLIFSTHTWTHLSRGGLSLYLLKGVYSYWACFYRRLCSPIIILSIVSIRNRCFWSYSAVIQFDWPLLTPRLRKQMAIASLHLVH